MGENRYLGAIVVSGSSLNNITTAAPFAIPPGTKLTLNASANLQILVDNLTTATSGANKGIPVLASSNFPTSVGKAITTLNANPTAVIAAIGTGTLDVWQRDGTE